jgi:hypothetical protein
MEEELKFESAELLIAPVSHMISVADLSQVRAAKLSSPRLSGASTQSAVCTQVYELELPILGAPQEFFRVFYADHAEWTQLQHRERGDKGAQPPFSQGAPLGCNLHLA